MRRPDTEVALVRRLPPEALGPRDGGDDARLFTATWEPTDDRQLLRNVTVPTLTPYLPDPGERTGTSVVVVPGGGLHFLAVENEGSRVAERLAMRGVAAFVLCYRLVPTPVDDAAMAAVAHRIGTDPQFVADVSRARRAPALADAVAALRHVRGASGRWGLDRDRVGMLGFSAGGFVSLVATLDTATADRPSFVAPIYPAWWGDVAVPEVAPPMFLAWAADDDLGETVTGSCARLRDAWTSAGAPLEWHTYPSGGHGFGMRTQGTASDAWFDAFLRWLGTSGS